MEGACSPRQGKGACSPPGGEGACSPDTEPHKAALTSGVWQPSSTRAPAPLKAPHNATHVDCLEGRSPRRENASPLTHSRAGRASANPPKYAPPALQGEPLRALINSQPFHVLHQLCPHHLGVPYLEAERLVLLFAFFFGPASCGWSCRSWLSQGTQAEYGPPLETPGPLLVWRVSRDPPQHHPPF